MGEIDPEAQRLIDVTEASLAAGIEAMQPGGRLSDIGAAVQGVAEAAGFSVVKEYTGHGIGTGHARGARRPQLGPARQGPQARPRPDLRGGAHGLPRGARTKLLDDQWTVVTADGSLAAHTEHTIAITEHGPEILTRP